MELSEVVAVADCVVVAVAVSVVLMLLDSVVVGVALSVVDLESDWVDV